MKNLVIAISMLLLIACQKNDKLIIEIHNDNTTGDPQPWRFFKINGQQNDPISPNEIQTFETEIGYEQITISFKHPDNDSLYHDRVIQVDGQEKIIFKIPY